MIRIRIFLLGNFNYLGIGTEINKENSIELYENAANLELNIISLKCIKRVKELI